MPEWQTLLYGSFVSHIGCAKLSKQLLSYCIAHAVNLLRVAIVLGYVVVERVKGLREEARALCIRLP